MTDQIVKHYEPGNLRSAIEAGLQKLVGDSRAPTIDDLAPVDEFHIGGSKASAHLFDQLNLTAEHRVLDIGSGIGGTARFVAHNYGSTVDGIDLTPEFCDVARSLNDLVGLSDRVTVNQGSALAMPFEPDTFDAAYMMHVGMNIEDKAALFSEAWRVLKPGATFAIYDILKGESEGAFEYPVPWASTSDSSFLTSADDMLSLLEGAGFTVSTNNDRTEFAIEFFAAALAATADGPPPIGLHLILGDNARLKLTNIVTNIKNGLCGPWELIARKSAGG